MFDRLRERLRKLTYDDVVDWVGEKTASRGFLCRENVGEVAELDDGYAAHVQGTELYVTNLYADAYDEFCSVCTCPVHVNCKHGAALAFAVSDNLREGKCVERADDVVFRLDRDAILDAKKAALRPLKKPEVTYEVPERAVGEEIRTLIRPQRRFVHRSDFEDPVPERVPDFARAYRGAKISFPDNRFKTSIWPTIRCGTAADVRKFLSEMPLIGREIFEIQTFGSCPYDNEQRFLSEAGIAYSDEDDLENWNAYLRIADDTLIEHSVSANRAVRVAFSRGGTFEIDGGDAPNLYLAANQIGKEVKPERDRNVDLARFFADVCGKKIEKVEVVSSFHDCDPMRFEPYDKPMELADSLIFWLDDGCGLRFRADGHCLVMDTLDENRQTRSLAWRELKGGMYNDADLYVDPASGYVASSRWLMFSRKGIEAAGPDAVILMPGARDSSFRRWSAVGRAAIPWEHTGILSLAAHCSGMAKNEWECVLEREEWNGVLAEAERLMASDMMGSRGIMDHFLERRGSECLVKDLREWSNLMMEGECPIRVRNLYGKSV